MSKEYGKTISFCFSFLIETTLFNIHVNNSHSYLESFCHSVKQIERYNECTWYVNNLILSFNSAGKAQLLAEKFDFLWRMGADY